MKKAIFHIAKNLVCIMSVYGAMFGASTQAHAIAASCPKPPSYIQIDYQFEWSPAEQKRLIDDFQMKCGLPRDVDWLVGRSASALKGLGFSVTNSRLFLNAGTETARIKLKTDKDDGQPRSVLFPVKYFQFDDSILSYADITGIVREDETLVLRYALDDSRIRDPNSRVVVQWLRDGQHVKGAQKSRYRLTVADVGSELAASVTVQDSRGVVYAQRTIKLKKKVGRVISLPEVRNLKIEGDAVVGKLVVASYSYADRNTSDHEENSRFVWLRDDFVIAEARGPAYQIVPQDVGKRISVSVTPRNVREETGTTKTVAMEKIVEDELVTLRPEILAGIGKKNDVFEFFEPIQITERVHGEFEGAKAPLKNPIDTKLSETHYLYLTPELSIAHTSVRKITDIVYQPANPFTGYFSENIKYQFFGEKISVKTARTIIQQLNLELRNANYKEIEAYFPKQIVKDGVLQVQFRKVQKKVDSPKKDKMEKIRALRYLLIGAGVFCCI